MRTDYIEVGGFALYLSPIQSTGAWFVREIGNMVDGTVEIYRVLGPRDIGMEIHYIKLESGHKWVVAGETNFMGPRWIFGQVNDRLRMSVIDKPQGCVFDLTIPKPRKRGGGAYTASKATIEELLERCPDMLDILKHYGAKKIGTRAESFGDKSSRKRYLSVIIESHDCIAPVIAYLITRLLSLANEFELLVSSGELDEAHISHYTTIDVNTIQAIPKRHSIEDVIDQGESSTVEFKPAIWYNHGKAMNDPGYVPHKDSSVSDNIVRTVAGFLNSEGGVLFIGVGDDGSSYGIENDILLTGRSDMDGLENELTRLLSDAISNEVVANKVNIQFPKFKGKTIVRITVDKAGAPVFMKTNRHKNKFYVRIGNATNTMSIESAFNYISQRDWSHSE